jgi:hypothetical protein
MRGRDSSGTGTDLGQFYRFPLEPRDLPVPDKGMPREKPRMEDHQSSQDDISRLSVCEHILATYFQRSFRR